MLVELGTPWQLLSLCVTAFTELLLDLLQVMLDEIKERDADSEDRYRAALDGQSLGTQRGHVSRCCGCSGGGRHGGREGALTTPLPLLTLLSSCTAPRPPALMNRCTAVDGTCSCMQCLSTGPIVRSSYDARDQGRRGARV